MEVLIGGVLQCYSIVLLEYSTDVWFRNASTDDQLLMSTVSKRIFRFSNVILLSSFMKMMQWFRCCVEYHFSNLPDNFFLIVNLLINLQILLKVHC